MAKQIFISDEVYKILLENKGEYDSFSNVIIKKFKSKSNIKEIVERIKNKPLDKSFSPNKKLLNKGWKKWEQSLIK
ncbi:hypothetical protein CMI38_04165 [Candidatus Pacearchaeota archaeon]|nr:hypothetical protein [Candidatus Pacearchaeota archaeon]|tara:strand:+ start:131 stop:358 length:228 start_codon:yes stop_codon:yes gene_type:complete